MLKVLGGFCAAVFWDKDRFKVNVYNKRRPRLKLSVLELNYLPRRWKMVHIGNEVLAQANFLVGFECCFKLEMAKAALAEIFMAIMLIQIRKEPT